ncbi:MAG: class I SAM-dependent methyltransferase [Rhizobiaceae bacterium]|nr:class I SAM-dependent methyltransferase [Rhizobiaceae bacterium]
MDNIKETVPAASQSARSTYSSAVAEADRYTDWILSLFEKRLQGRVLEIGVAHGSYTQRLSNGDYVGIDIDPLAVEEARARFPGVQLEVADIADRKSLEVLSAGSVDSIVCFNVLEHVERHRDAVNNLLELLRPGGYLFLFVPAMPGLYNDMDRLAGHFRRYTRQAMQEVFEGQPAEIERLEYVNPVGGVGWWANKLKKHDNLDSGEINSQIRFFMSYLLPVSTALGVVTRNVFGQSLIVEARRT